MFCDAAVFSCVGLAVNFFVSDTPRPWIMQSLIRGRRNKRFDLYQIDFQVPVCDAATPWNARSLLRDRLNKQGDLARAYPLGKVTLKELRLQFFVNWK